MFMGEMGCWLFVAFFAIYSRLVSKTRGYTPLRDISQEDANPALKPLVAKEDGRKPLGGWATLLLALPACCDITGTTLMNVGLLFVAASIYQMTRGALVLFVGLFSVIFLKRRLYAYQWLALFFVMLGVGIVGLAGSLTSTPEIKTRSLSETALLALRAVLVEVRETAETPDVLKIVLGILMIAGAQIFTATQFVFEEFILEKYSVKPLKMIGWEGLFGFIITMIGMVVLHITIGSTPKGQYGYFDLVEGWRQVTSYRQIATSSVLIMISIGGFNFFGLSVTRSVSATSRSTIDTCRTLFIWIVSLGLHWETFKWLQIVGFVLLVYGTFLFNDIVGLPWQACIRRRRRDVERLLPEEPIEHN
jgi:drug/metabolite transporter (DMT)-like permease